MNSKRCVNCLLLTASKEGEICDKCFIILSDNIEAKENRKRNNSNKNNTNILATTANTSILDIEEVDLNTNTFKKVSHNKYIKKEVIPIKFYLDKNALEAETHPRKNNPTDSGYDLSILSIEKVISKNTIMYDTGIRVVLPPGYYCEVYPRSSITKLGYILTNSVGIIDNSFRGSIKIVLTKINDDAEDINIFPLRVAQLIVRKLEDTVPEYYETVNAGSDLHTVRGDNGFGSSGFGLLK